MKSWQSRKPLTCDLSHHSKFIDMFLFGNCSNSGEQTNPCPWETANPQAFFEREPAVAWQLEGDPDIAGLGVRTIPFFSRRSHAAPQIFCYALCCSHWRALLTTSTCRCSYPLLYSLVSTAGVTCFTRVCSCGSLEAKPSVHPPLRWRSPLSGLIPGNLDAGQRQAG
jgi:hypothetical protein